MATFTTYRDSLFIHGRDYNAFDVCELIHAYLDNKTTYDIEWTDVDGCDGGIIRNIDITAIPRNLCEIRRVDFYAYTFIITPSERRKRNVQKKD